MPPFYPWVLPFPLWGWSWGSGTQPLLSDDCMTIEQKYMMNAYKIKELEDRVKALEEQNK